MGADDLSSGMEARQGYDILTRNFSAGWMGPIAVLVKSRGEGNLRTGERATAIAALSARLASDPRVRVVGGYPSADGRSALVFAVPRSAPESDEVMTLVRELRTSLAGRKRRRSHGSDRWLQRKHSGFRRRAVRKPEASDSGRAGDHVHRPGPRISLDRCSNQGDHDESDLGTRGVWVPRLRVSGGRRRQPDWTRASRRIEFVHRSDAVYYPLRVVDGLRGVSAQPYQGGIPARATTERRL